MSMKQTNPAEIEKAKAVMAELKEIRGGELLSLHRQLANDPQSLAAFKDIFLSCNGGETVIPKKYRELMIMLLGCSRGIATTAKVHGENAVKAGATIQEVGEAIRLAMMICGASAVIPAAGLFEELEES